MATGTAVTRADLAFARGLSRLDLGVREELDDLRSIVRSFLARPQLDPQPDVDPARERERWSVIHRGLDIAGLLVPLADGGSGYGCTEAAVVAEELGRRLACGDFLTTSVVAATLVGRLDGAAAAGLRARIASGRTVLGLVADHVVDPASRSEVKARQAGDRWTVTGTSTVVIASGDADELLVLARTGDGTRALLVDPGQTGVSLQRQTSLDLTRPLSKVVLHDAAATDLGDVTDAIGPATTMGAVVQCAELVGVASWCLDATLEHAHVRQQFGVSIGSFQAVKHQCADLLMDLEASRSLLAFAVSCVDEEQDADLAAAILGAFVPEMAVLATTKAVQLHGGIGFTWEHPAHLYVRRARAGASLIGTPDRHRALLTAALELEDRS